MRNTILFLVLNGLFCLTINAQQIKVSQLKKDVAYLADDKLEGRGTGEKGCEMAADYIAGRFKKIGLLPYGDENSYLKKYSVKVPSNPHASTDTAAKEVQSANCVGFINNNAEFTIVIGAHYDHLGWGKDGNSLDANPKGKIHNGADDNASGVAGVIELARYFKNNKNKEKYNFLFICFSGEELGLFGSKFYTEHPTV